MGIDFSQVSQPSLVYSTLLIGTLMVLFFAVFFRDPPKVLKE
uniref:Photosystem II protein T n=1 Tax=Protohalopteris sp. TaxID=2843287 RepID=A0A8F0JXU7_9PHAE|nr:Photosystem II reaction center protein T [Phaeostrophion irregulare]QWK41895.1 photosystem II protein T [Protohalopteris sp.]WAM64250.1 Photosystem II reaction center protein T [Phaeostrophion irregulare]